MESSKPRIRIELTEQQRQKLNEAFGKEFEVIEFNVEQLEQRIAPFCASGQHFPR